MFSLKISCAAHLMLCNCLSSRSCLSLSCSGWLSVQMTLSETETARTPSKSKIFTLSFNTLPFCLSSQARTTQKNKKARSQLLTIASTFNCLLLLQLFLANCILLQEVLPKQSNKQKTHREFNQNRAFALSGEQEAADLIRQDILCLILRLFNHFNVLVLL